ncbi:hypothetical protein [Bacillus subtilis]|uniref:hypothetical protein n=1 Tax=Bacillus subtilis TaxID=1423 RepID=UPI00129EF944|nr:hypothetical protein GII77_06905 [Bacillus subtilis]
MTETNAKIHVLADETLGGIKREYVEVDRKAEVGEKIVIVEADCQSEYRNGDMAFVSRFVKDDSRIGYYAESILANGQLVALYDREYHVLEPTDIVIVNGQRYEMVNDNAQKGDMVIVTGSYDYAVGHVDTVKEVDSDHLDGSVYLVEGENGETYLDGTEEDYRVLVPVESAEADEPQPIDPIFAIGNVAQEVAKLKRTVERLENEIDTLHKDNRTLGEELQKTQQDLRETMDDVSVMDEDIKRTGSDINEMSFAVEELAEALKKTDPVYGERIFTAEEVVAVMTALKVRP